MKLEFHTPYNGDWLIIIDSETGKEIYSGHGSGDEMYAVLEYAKIENEWIEHPDKEFEEKFC